MKTLPPTCWKRYYVGSDENMVLPNNLSNREVRVGSDQESALEWESHKFMPSHCHRRIHKHTCEKSIGTNK